MRLLLRINLCLSSLLLALNFSSCSPASGHKFIRSAIVTEKEVHPIVSKNNALLYKAKIDLFNHHFSGLIVLKQINDSTSHLTFVTEIGLKMFDYEIKNDAFTLVYVFEPLNKPKILALLKEDMKLILLQHLLNKEAQLYQEKDNTVYKIKTDFRYYYQMQENATNVRKIVKKGNLFTKVRVAYFYTTDQIASKIKLRHKGLIRLKIELNTLNTPAFK